MSIARHAPAGRIAVVCGKGNNGGDGLVAARRAPPGRPRGRRSWPSGGWRRSRATPPRCSTRLPGEPPQPFEAGRLEGAHGIVDALLGTGTTGAPREPAAGVIEAINAARRAGDRRRRAVRRRRVHRRGGRPGGPGDGHRHLPPRQAGPVDPPRQGPRRRRRGDRHRDPVRRAGRARDRPDPAGRARGDAAPHAGVDQVQLRQRVRDRRLVRPHGRAHDGRAWRRCAPARAT